MSHFPDWKREGDGTVFRGTHYLVISKKRDGMKAVRSLMDEASAPITMRSSRKVIPASLSLPSTPPLFPRPSLSLSLYLSRPPSLCPPFLSLFLSPSVSLPPATSLSQKEQKARYIELSRAEELWITNVALEGISRDRRWFHN